MKEALCFLYSCLSESGWHNGTVNGPHDSSTQRLDKTLDVHSHKCHGNVWSWGEQGSAEENLYTVSVDMLNNTAQYIIAFICFYYSFVYYHILTYIYICIHNIWHLYDITICNHAFDVSEWFQVEFVTHSQCLHWTRLPDERGGVSLEKIRRDKKYSCFSTWNPPTIMPTIDKCTNLWWFDFALHRKWLWNTKNDHPIETGGLWGSRHDFPP